MSSEPKKFFESRIVSWAALSVISWLQLGSFLGTMGPLLVVWGYFFDTNPGLIGLHFLAFSLGYGATSLLPMRYRAGWGLAWGSVVAALALMGLTLAAPPAPMPVRLTMLALLGAAAGTLVKATLYQAKSHKPVPSAGPPGVLFGLGCLLATLTFWTAYAMDKPRWTPALLAILPCASLLSNLRSARGTDAEPTGETGSGDRFQGAPDTNLPVEDFRSTSSARELPQIGPEQRRLASLVLAALLGVQWGAEWTIAGWLPLFLIRILGSSPSAALLVLAAFFLVLGISRIISAQLLKFVGKLRFLLIAAGLTSAGYVLLAMSSSLPDTNTGVLLIGLGFGPIYPVVLETLDERFAFDPRLCQRLLLVGITGAMSFACLVGFIYEWLGFLALPILPATGSAIVLLLAALLMLERRLMGATVSAR